MGFIVHKEPPPDYLVTMGKGKKIIEAYAAEPKEAPKLEKPIKRRLKVERKPDADVETIHKEDPGKQGPVGTDRQEPPPRDLGGDVNVGHGEDEDNGKE